MELIPAIDIKDGYCVRLYQGDFERVTVYDEDPAAVARRWVDAGATRLHIVDLDGARSGKPVHTDAIRAIVRAVDVPIQLGGGLRREETVEAALALGVARTILGTAAVEDPELIARLVARHGDAIVVGVDARDGIVATAGWTSTATVYAADLVAQMGQLGVRRVIYTDIARDGTLTSPNYAATAALVSDTGPAIIASGGVGAVEHLLQLRTIGVEAAIVGRALYTGDLSLEAALAALG
ncbi:MAG TPA: 1-(5-phosphoribosyl)-5-[(5-phosphoribosylamino)methylideneamino]imidazole-4-carboxamide isomerase [Roseiflexaceae bacterium]|nr:1-(5-phosphoribosyl)-5-[(5-phosphoribosylamino)methylideneamino]imidazole-4-carboxamide isomerase [Roseiflexaceae bacterium]HMP39489.1 1-(5-phosphoribosyl)-5-[(5-phosphoribosylamino)methylideneamino]imidazole-4-carboxamide isomerase [Roseiflexaceae bacterium]